MHGEGVCRGPQAVSRLAEGLQEAENNRVRQGTMYYLQALWDLCGRVPRMLRIQQMGRGVMSDLISRQAAIRVASGYCHPANIAKELEKLPSVQPDKDLIHLQKEQAYMQGYEDGKKSRKGKWIRTRTMTHDGELYCDQCEQEHPEQKIIWNFCPNCGCRMEEGDSE